MANVIDLDVLMSHFKCYKHHARMRNDVAVVVRKLTTLRPISGNLVTNTGEYRTLLTLLGTVGIVFREAHYNIPVEIYMTENYPASPPVVYVRPTRDMEIKKGHRHVDSAGMVYLPYLHEWSEATHNLEGLCAALSAVFSQDPPVFARPPPGTVAAQPQPVQQPREDPAVVVKRELVAKLQQSLQGVSDGLRRNIDTDFEAQVKLQENNAVLESNLEEAKRQLAELSALIPRVQECRAAVVAHGKDLEGPGGKVEPVHAEDLVITSDVLSGQLATLVAENAALEDTIYNLDKGWTEGRMSADDSLKEIRRLSRKQFLSIALAKKVGEVQRAQRSAQAQAQQASRSPSQPPMYMQQQQQQLPAYNAYNSPYMAGGQPAPWLR